jgi:glutaconyl-CoA/methylmalonyl-CoA decarboxylase subunit gamma
VRRYTVVVDGTPFSLDVEETAADRFTVTVGGHTFEAHLEAAEDLPGAEITPEMQSAPGQNCDGASPGVNAPGGAGPARVAGLAAGMTPAPNRPASGTAPGVVRAPAGTGSARASIVAAPMPGVVLEVITTAGAEVRRGDPLLVLEAMKMRNTVRAPRDALVLEVTAEAGRPVLPGEPLVRLGDLGR